MRPSRSPPYTPLRPSTRSGAHAAAKCLVSLPDHSALIYGTSKGDVRLWQFGLPSSDERVLYTHPLVRVLGYLSAQQIIASGGYDKYLRIHKVEGDLLAVREMKQVERSDVVRALAWASRTPTLAFASGAELNLIILSEKLEPVSDPVRLLGHTGVILSIAWNKGDNLVASGDEDGTVIVWNPVSRRHTAKLDRSLTLQSARSLSFHPILQNVLAIGGKSGVLEIVTFSENESPRVMTVGHFGTFINAIHWHHSGSPLVFACGGAIKSLEIELPTKLP